MPKPSREEHRDPPGVLARRPGDPDPYEMASDFEADEAGMEVDAEASNEMNTDFVGNFSVTNGLGRLEPTFDDEVSALLLGPWAVPAGATAEKAARPRDGS